MDLRTLNDWYATSERIASPPESSQLEAAQTCLSAPWPIATTQTVLAYPGDLHIGSKYCMDLESVRAHRQTHLTTSRLTSSRKCMQVQVGRDFQLDRCT